MANNDIQKASGEKKGIAFRQKVGKVIRSVPFIGTVIGILAGIIGFLIGFWRGSQRMDTSEVDSEYLEDGGTIFVYDENGEVVGTTTND